MTNAEGLRNSILEDAVKEAGTIKESALQQKQQMLAAVEEEMRIKTQEILKKARADGENRKMRELAANALEIKKRNLERKRALLDEAFQQALERLRKLPKEEYLSYAVKNILAFSSTGSETVVVGSDETCLDEEIIRQINEQLKGKKDSANLKFQRADTPFQGGFLLRENGLEMNFTFREVIAQMQEECEAQAARILFG